MTLVPWPVTDAWAIEHDRTLAGAGVVLGDPDDQAGDDEAENAADEQVLAGDRHAGDEVADLAPADRVVRGGARPATDSTPPTIRPLYRPTHDRAVGAELDEERADDRGDDAGAANRERIEHPADARIGWFSTKKDRREHHGGDDSHRIGFEQIGRHAGAVTDVITDVIGDGCRVARLVFRNAGFDLADEVGADVGNPLGEDHRRRDGRRSRSAKRRMTARPARR